MKKVFFMCLAAMFFLVACGSKSNETGTNPDGINTSSSRPVNPPHGMPGHTCAVPDGAPLPQGTVQPSLQNNMPVKSDVQGFQELNKTLNVNPAHGQPGHRCDIAVGAPIK